LPEAILFCHACGQEVAEKAKSPEVDNKQKNKQQIPPTSPEATVPLAPAASPAATAPFAPSAPAAPYPASAPIGQPQNSSAKPPKKPRKIWLWIILALVGVALIVGITLLLANLFGSNDTEIDKPALELNDAVAEKAEPDEPLEAPEKATEEEAEEPEESSEIDFDSITLVGSWKNIMTQGGYATVEFTEEGRFTLVDRDGGVTTGNYTIPDGTLKEGTVECHIDDSPLSITGDFHLNGKILTWGNMMFILE